MKLKCKKCGNEWEYKGSNKYYATCSHCLSKVRIKKKVGGKNESRPVK